MEIQYIRQKKEISAVLESLEVNIWYSQLYSLTLFFKQSSGIAFLKDTQTFFSTSICIWFQDVPTLLSVHNG